MSETDWPGRVPRKAAEYEEIARAPTSVEYEKSNKPFQPPKEKLPTMSENWAYAMRRYGRFQGYAWAAVGGAAIVAYGVSRVTEAPKAGGAGSAQQPGDAQR